MERMVTPSGVEVLASDSDRERFLREGYRPVGGKAAPKRRAPRKAQKPQEKK